MAALDARQIDEARAASNQRATGKRQFRHRLRAAFGDRARAIADALSAGKNFGDGRVGFGALEFAEGVQPGILVVEMDHKTDGAEIVAPVVHEQSAAGFIVQRPAHAMQHQTFFVLAGRQLPQFLETDAELLRLAPFLQAKLGTQFLGQRTARAFGEEVYLPRSSMPGV